MASSQRVYRNTETPLPWWHQAASKLTELEQLPKSAADWRAKSPTVEARLAAMHVLDRLRQDPTLTEVPVPEVFPTADQGLQFEWRAGERELEISFAPDGTVEYLRLHRGESNEGPLTGDIASHVRSLLVRWLAE